jgi:esterase/lipase superfamily enzyme
VRATWLRRVGDEGTSALKLLDQVIREQPPAPPPTPSSGPRSSSPARIFFATNRNDEGGVDLSYRFGIDRNSTLLCGEVAYVPDSTRDFGIAHKGAISVAGSRTVSGAASCAQLVGASAKGSNGAMIVFIHGFRNTFDFAVRRAIAFTQDFGVGATVLVFSWPSFGTVSGYVYDIGSVSFTRPFAKDLLDALHRESDVRSISLLAHSMGSQIAFQLLEFAKSGGKRIDSVVFVAPDVPRVNFVQGIQLYGASTRLATLYANEHDRALLLSQEANKQAPAGLGGPSRLTTNGVETVDVSEVDKQLFEVNHSHGFDVQKVASDVSLVLRQRAKASMRNLPSATQDGFTYWQIRP